MDYADRKKAAAAFAKKWQGRGYEKGETALFWTDFLRDVVGMENVSDECRFEERTRDGGFIDAWLPVRGVIIEQKSAGVDLDKPEVRQGREVTPYQQALAYALQMPLNQQPTRIVVCNFETFRIHDRNKQDPERDYVEIPLADLAKNIALFGFFGGATSRSEREKDVSIKAGALIGKLHAALSECYIDPDSEDSQHSLNVLCVRLVFCLYAEDSGLFGKDVFLNYLKQYDARQMRRALQELFTVLDTPVAERDPYLDEDLKRFPYVNGGLFRDVVEIPNFTDDIRLMLLLDVSQQTDWSGISPTIFGGVFESTLNPQTRRTGGMHYTSPENIHKLIDPLFLDDLRAEYRSIKEDAALGDNKRRSRLLEFQEKLASLTFLDPACGSGNFLTETYLCLRRLENYVLADLMNIRGKDRTKKQFVENQTAMDFVGADTGDSIGVKVSIRQFYGIEINDFAVSVAKTALWIAELQANVESEYVIARDIEDLPLRDSGNIVKANALRIDWNDLLPASECDYIMGNPPFVGYKEKSSEQKGDLESACLTNGQTIKNVGSVDYVAGWYYKAAQQMQSNRQICAAFVSTSSLCQGEQVYWAWKPLFEDYSIHISFAHKPFVWDSEASEKAHVHVVIVGFAALEPSGAILYANEVAKNVSRINAYLAEAPDVWIKSRRKPLCRVREIVLGVHLLDNHYFIFNEAEKEEFVESEPGSAHYFRPWVSAKDFLYGTNRWFLDLAECPKPELFEMKKCSNLVRAVAEYRSNNKSCRGTRLETDPFKPKQGWKADCDYLAIPNTSSEKRKYLPVLPLESSVVISMPDLAIPGGGLYEFGILSSSFHMAWISAVAGRLENRFRYANGIVYNNFPWPQSGSEERIANSAQRVLDCRKEYRGICLADLYNPKRMPPDLLEAHKSLDTAVEAAYGVDFGGDEEKIVAHLFKLYAELTEGE